MSPRTYIRRKKLEHVRHPDGSGRARGERHRGGARLRFYPPRAFAELYKSSFGILPSESLRARPPGKQAASPRWSARGLGAAAPARPAASTAARPRRSSPRPPRLRRRPARPPATPARPRLAGCPSPPPRAGSPSPAAPRSAAAGLAAWRVCSCACSTATPRRSWPRSAARRANLAQQHRAPEQRLPGGAGQAAQGQPGCGLRVSRTGDIGEHAHPRQSPESTASPRRPGTTCSVGARARSRPPPPAARVGSRRVLITTACRAASWVPWQTGVAPWRARGVAHHPARQIWLRKLAR